MNMKDSPFYYVGYVSSGLRVALDSAKYGKGEPNEFIKDHLERSLQAMKELEALLKKGTFTLTEA